MYHCDKGINMSKSPSYTEMLDKYGKITTALPVEIVNSFRFSGIQGGCDICGADMIPEFTAGNYQQTSPSVTEIEVVCQCQRCQTEVYFKGKVNLSESGFPTWYNVKRSYKSPGLKSFFNKIQSWLKSHR
jgi:hypothetical protein